MAGVDGLFKSPLLVVLLRLLMFERGPLTAEELSERADAAYPTVTKEVRRLEQLDIVTVRTVGRTKLIAANRADPAVRSLTRLFVTAGLGPTPERGDDMAKKKAKKKDSKKKKKK